MKNRILPIMILVFLGLASGFTTPQDLKPNMQLIREQWARSLHAMSLDTEENRKLQNSPGCAHCHTAQGYWEVILGKKESSAPYEKPISLTCVTCHFPEKIASGDGALRVGKAELACPRCHDIMVQNDPHGFSSCLQGSVLEGTGGAYFEDTKDQSGAHTDIRGGCVGCHMALTPEGRFMYLLGGHSFRVITKGELGRHFNSAACQSCHEDITLADVEKSQQAVKTMMAELEELLPKFIAEETGAPAPKFPKDPTLTEVQSRASFNYYFVLKDGTWGVHNPVYIRKLLEDSMAALKTEKNSN